MAPLKWYERKCFLVGRTKGGWPVVHFDDDGLDVALLPEQVQHFNPDRDVKALTRSAPLVPPLFGD